MNSYPQVGVLRYCYIHVGLAHFFNWGVGLEGNFLKFGIIIIYFIFFEGVGGGGGVRNTFFLGGGEDTKIFVDTFWGSSLNFFSGVILGSFYKVNIHNGNINWGMLKI